MNDFAKTIFVVMVFTTLLAYASLTFKERPQTYTKTVTNVSQARSFMRECIKTLNGTATVKTNWAQDVPSSWVVTCRSEKK